MKKFFRKLVLWILKKLAKFRLKRFKGKIVVVTGSVGKTSTKESIFCVLNSKFKVKRSEKNMNSDFGLPLTILDIKSGYASAVKWAWLLSKAFVHALSRDHSEILLLELGVDKPGDMNFLTSIVKPDLAVLTNIFPVHLGEGQFKDLQEIFEEKRKAVSALKKDGVAVLNIDNAYLEHLAKGRDKKDTVTFGQNKDAMYVFSNVSQSIDGIKFDLKAGDQQFEVHSSILGAHNVYNLVSSIICGVLMGMSLDEAGEALHRFSLPPGRLNIIPAINDAVILDSSYNSSPAALKESLKVLKEVGQGKRKVAVLGNMNELGEESGVLHEMIGDIVPECADMLLTVGKDAKLIAKSAKKNGMDEKNITTFKNALEAAEFFEKEIKKDDVVLVKGSQNKVRLERFVKKLMENPEDAKKLLVRQEKVWKPKY